MMKEKPNYYSIITAEVRYDKNLTPNAKLLYAEITSLCNMNGKCTAHTDYFCKLYGVSKVSVQKWLKQLEDRGYIHREVEYAEGSKQILTRYITILYYPSKEKLTTPSKEKLIDNNTISKDIDNNINTTYSNKEKINKKENFDFIKNEEFKKLFFQWIDYRKKIKKPLRQISLKANYDKLIKLSNGNLNVASEIIGNSIANGWIGLFALKKKGNKIKDRNERNMEAILQGLNINNKGEELC